jgi:RNA polymerase sigma factor (sigma-70 family)
METTINDLNERDRDALERVCDRYYPIVERAAKRHLQVLGLPEGVAEPDDIVQTVLTNLCVRAGGKRLFESHEDLRVFLLLMIKERTTNRIRAANALKRQRPGTGDRIPEDLVGMAEQPIDAAELEEWLYHAIGHLPVDERGAILCRLRGLSDSEAAAELGIAARTYRHIRLCGEVKLKARLEES